jgi:hypothetical protein
MNEDVIRPQMTREEFAALARHKGLSLSPEQTDELYGAFRYVEKMAQRVRASGADALWTDSAVLFKPVRRQP